VQFKDTHTSNGLLYLTWIWLGLALHRWFCCGICLYTYTYIVRPAVGHFRLLFYEFLRHSLIQKLFTNYSVTRHKPPYLLDSNSKDRDHLWTTYSMTKAMGVIPWQKGFIFQCHCLCCNQPLQWPHWWACQQECNLSVCTSCKAHGVLDPCACSTHTDQAWHACWTS